MTVNVKTISEVKYCMLPRFVSKVIGGEAIFLNFRTEAFLRDPQKNPTYIVAWVSVRL